MTRTNLGAVARIALGDVLAFAGTEKLAVGTALDFARFAGERGTARATSERDRAFSAGLGAFS